VNHRPPLFSREDAKHDRDKTRRGSREDAKRDRDKARRDSREAAKEHEGAKAATRIPGSDESGTTTRRSTRAGSKQRGSQAWRRRTERSGREMNVSYARGTFISRADRSVQAAEPPRGHSPRATPRLSTVASSRLVGLTSSRLRVIPTFTSSRSSRRFVTSGAVQTQRAAQSPAPPAAADRNPVRPTHTLSTRARPCSTPRTS